MGTKELHHIKRAAAFLLVYAWTAGGAAAALVSDVRKAIARKDLKAAAQLVEEHRRQRGVDPEFILALSWLGRGALGEKRWEEAERYAAETRALAMEQLKNRALDAEPQLPLALGASIEVQAQVMAGRNQLSEAIAFLQEELNRWAQTSMRTRIQKNIHLLSLEGKTPPQLELSHWLGPKPLPPAQLKGKAVLLFFWAHWCGDCKQQAPVLARLEKEFGPRGLVIIGPTQRYGYVAGGVEAPPEEELRYIEQVRLRHYGMLASMPVPVSEENFRIYGSSTTPTLVLLDRQGVVRMYHPGRLPYEELVVRVKAALGG